MYFKTKLHSDVRLLVCLNEIFYTLVRFFLNYVHLLFKSCICKKEELRTKISKTNC